MDRFTMEDIGLRALSGEGITEPQALRIADCSREELLDLVSLSNRVRQEFRGSTIKLCGIVNAKSGWCSEDCAFCAQSSHHHTAARNFGLISKAKLLNAAKKAFRNGAREFSIVTSGKTLGDKELSKVMDALADIKAVGLGTCASLGILGPEALEELAKAGLDKYHHNLETSRSFFPRICTTHDYEEDVQTVRAARDAGLVVCCGGIFGLGETARDWVELVSTLRELEVDSIPLNFHNPVEGTKLDDIPLLAPLDAIRIITIFRLALPRRDIVICGGREVTLRDLQCLVLPAGANGLMLGDYLTTSGRDPKFDMQMLRDLGLTSEPVSREGT
jgi:biotin synthase